MHCACMLPIIDFHGNYIPTKTMNVYDHRNSSWVTSIELTYTALWSRLN